MSRYWIVQHPHNEIFLMLGEGVPRWTQHELFAHRFANPDAAMDEILRNLGGRGHIVARRHG